MLRVKQADREGSVPATALALAVALSGWSLGAANVAWAQEERPAAEKEAPPSAPVAEETFAGEEAGSPAAGSPAAGSPAAGSPAGLGFETSIDEEDFDAIDNLLREDQAVRAGPQAETYDPGTRRDPFRSLIVQRERPQETEAERPDGIAGLLIDEIELQGVFELPEGPVVQIMSASHETSYLLRPGDELWDGDVVSISLEEVVFKQVVTDTEALKPFQLVVKRLNP